MAYIEKVLYVDSVAYGPPGADGGLVARWTATTAYIVGQIVRQRAAPTIPNERCFVCILAGTSLASEPTWGASPIKGALITEAGGPKWQECTGQPPVNGDFDSTNRWTPSISNVFLGVIITNTAATHYFIAQNQGISAATEPAWNTTPGASTTDSSVTWICLGPVSSFTTRWAAPFARLGGPYNSSTNWLVNSDMIVFVGDDHAETQSTAINITPPSVGNSAVVCVDHVVALPPIPTDIRTTATVTQTGSVAMSLFTQQGTYVYGVQFINAGTNAALNIGSGNHQATRYDTCVFSITGTGTSQQIRISRVSSINGTQFEFKDCTFNFAASGQQIDLGLAIIKMENCNFTGVIAGTTKALFTGPNCITNFTAEGCDFTNLAAGSSLVARNVSGYLMFKDCLLPATLGTVFVSGDSNMFTGLVIDLVRCASDGTNYRNERHTAYGAQIVATKPVRTGGAVDDNMAISHQFVSTAAINKYSNVFNCWPLVVWNDIINADRFVTLYGIANDNRVPTDEEVWMVVEYLGSASSPKGSFKRGSKATLLSTPGALSSDTSAWDSNLTAVARSTAYAIGDIVKHASGPGLAFFCTAAGTTGVSEPVGGLVTWNTLDSTNVNLAGDNLTLTSLGSNAAIRSSAGQTEGKFYFECKALHIDQYLGYVTGVVGIITGSSTLTNYTNNGCTVDTQGTVWTCGTRFLNLLSELTAGNVFAVNSYFCVAIDPVNRRAWFRYNNGNWNGNAANDPTTNVGGVDISPLFPTNAAFAYNRLISSFSDSLLSWQANFGQSAFAFTVPSGFSSGPMGSDYASAIDGSVISDGAATMRAGCRFSQTLALNAPQPQQRGYLYAYPRIGRASVPYFIDPKLRLS